MFRSNKKVSPQYKMKHRLTGAVIIIVLAIIVISVLLKDPKGQSNVPSSNQDEQTQQAQQAQQTSESKTQPLNEDTANLDEANLQKTEVPIKTTEQTESTTEGTAFRSVVQNLTSEDLKLPGQSASDASEGDDSSNKNTITQIKLPEDILTKVDLTKKDAPKVEVAKKEQPKNNLPKGGWSVRVGTYSDIENVNTISKLLNNNGFKAQHTQIQTTSGETTRVWLGPYTKKKTAEKISTQIKSITGEKGYVTKNSS